jgi:hypothetical protein
MTMFRTKAVHVYWQKNLVRIMDAVKEQNPNQRKVRFCNIPNQNLRILGMYQLYSSKSVESIYGEELTLINPSPF